MVMGGVPPAGDAPIRVETLHESERTRVTRLILPGRSVVRKELLGPDRDRRLGHELEILGRLRGVAGVVQLADGPEYPGSIMLEDIRGTCLADRVMPLRRGEMVGLALELARAVAGMHRRGVVHRDIGPGNILLSEPGGGVCLVDFALATSFAEIRPEFTHHNEIVGTLAYLAPEQTGRAGRPVDQRADLYAVGATLYEVATGRPPFGTGDPLRLTHDHLARVPAPPAQVDSAVPAGLSQIIMHLLEKEPDSRYQTAQGLIHDLAQLGDGRPQQLALQVGEHDFPLRPLLPSRLVGRDDEIATLGSAFTEALSGRCRGVLVAGAAGVGKTSLIDELRPIVTTSDGWFVAGKFDQYRRDQEFDGVLQAFRGLGRLLLAEPEVELAELREAILGALGASAGLVTAVVPEMALLLKVPPDAGDPLTAQARAQRSAVEILRAVASRKRPVVLVVDDLQWAARTPLGFVDQVLGEQDMDGLLVVGAYRDDEVDAAHPLTAMLSRWQSQQGGPVLLQLDNLPPSSVAAMVADMLRLDAPHAGQLAEVITPHTRGNPYDTVELLNALRHNGILRPTAGGWRWDPRALGRYLGEANIAELLAVRPDAMPTQTRTILEAMACLGGRTELGLLQAATGLPAAAVEERLAPALDDGLLVMEPGDREAVRFRHDRLREVILLRLGVQQQNVLRLGMARRLSAIPDLFAAAAEQYLPVVDAVRDAGERRTVVGLFRRAADQANVLANHTVVEKLLAAAEGLTDPADTEALIELRTRHHAALYSLGRLDEADELYRTVDRMCTRAMQRVDATLTQVSSLANRNRYEEAIELGVQLLRQLGMAVPSRDGLTAEIDDDLDAFYRWLDQTDEAADQSRPDITDTSTLAAAALINRMMPTAYFGDRTMMAWLCLASLRIWAEHGPGRTLVGPASYIGFVTIALRQDYRAAYQAIRRILALSQARGYEPDGSQARLVFAVSACHWFEPLEDDIQQGRLAREGLLQGGDLANAGYTYYVTVRNFFDCAPTLDSYVTELEAGLAFARRTGNEQTSEWFTIERWLVRVLRGESGDSARDGVVSPDRYVSNPVSAGHAHTILGFAAAVFGDAAQLAQHSAAAKLLQTGRPDPQDGVYLTASAYLLRALALAGQARAATGAHRGEFLTELDEVIDWLSLRAADAPMNFLHLLRLVEAERAWALDDFRAAAVAFNAAQREAATRQRPWHRALIAECGARFYLAQGIERIGYGLLAEARQEYLSWGATAKVDQLDWAYPTLETPAHERTEPGSHPVERPTRRSSIMTGTIDLLGILAASQTLSSEKSIGGLRARVEEILGAMTGATGVHLLLWSHDQQGWLPSAPGGGVDDTVPLAQAGRRPLAPLSVVRYAERVGELFVLNDATRDDRFARDPYFTDIECCSMLVVPIHYRGTLQALLLLENRLIRAAFSTERLDGVKLLASQLAVSLDNALVYASLERKVANRTQELALAKERLELLSVTDPLTGLANRRRLEDVLSAAWQHGQRARLPIGLAMIDIDHFKLYNDHYGHAAGDHCLQRVATELAASMRDTDLVARYGGEEFAAVLPNTDIAAARHSAERMRAAVGALAIPHPLSTERLVTVSIGVGATVPQPNTIAESLLEVADAELYLAKRGGRNRVWG